MDYPVSFEVQRAERRSRLTVFFRLLLGIPQMLWAYLYGIAAGFGALAAWFALVVTGRYPAGLYNFNAQYVSWLARTTGYFALLTDAYPPFTGFAEDYPIHMRFEPLASYNRLKAFFRLLLAIPILIARYAMNILLELAAVAAWFAIIVLGRLPEGLFDTLVFANSYMARSDAYLFLLTETYPSFDAGPAASPVPPAA